MNFVNLSLIYKSKTYIYSDKDLVYNMVKDLFKVNEQ